jgi:hypothetical protein
MTAPPRTKSSLSNHATVTKTKRVQMCAEQRQKACTRGLTLYKSRVYLNSKEKMKTGSPDQEEASGIDN